MAFPIKEKQNEWTGWFCWWQQNELTGWFFWWQQNELTGWFFWWQQNKLTGWFCWWQWFLTVVASFSMYFNGFQLKSIHLNVHVGGQGGDVLSRRRKHYYRCCTFICKYIWIHINKVLIIKTKSITNSVPWSERSIQFHFLPYILNISINCFFALKRSFT